MTASAIKDLQEKLRYIENYTGGTNLAVDGIYSDDTRNSIANIQSNAGFDPTGETDRDTIDLINTLYDDLLERNSPAVQIIAFPNSEVILREGDEGFSTAVLNLMLAALSSEFANIPSISSTDRYGNDTAQGAAAVQQASRLPVNGETDKLTFNAIARLFNRYGGDVK